MSEIKERYCVNGCGAPVHAPSKVLCKKCFEALGAKIEAIGRRFDERAAQSAKKEKP